MFPCAYLLKRTWGMIFMILAPVGGSRTLCIFLLYIMSICKGKRFDETGILDIKCHTKKTETGQFLHMQVLMPSATHLRLFPSRWDHLLCKKKNQTNKQKQQQQHQQQQSWHICQKKKGFFMEKLSARGYNDAELFKADFFINFEDRQHFIKEKLKSTAIPLVFNTKYNRHFAGKYIRQALPKHWNIIDKNVRLKMIFPKPPMIAYSRSENLRDSLVRLNSLPRRRVTTRTTIFWEMKKILHPHQACKHFKIWSLRAKVSTCS